MDVRSCFFHTTETRRNFMQTYVFFFFEIMSPVAIFRFLKYIRNCFLEFIHEYLFFIIFCKMVCYCAVVLYSYW